MEVSSASPLSPATGNPAIFSLPSPPPCPAPCPLPALPPVVVQREACLKRPWQSPFLSYWPWTPCPHPSPTASTRCRLPAGSTGSPERGPALRWVLSSPGLTQPALLPCCPLPMTRSLLSELRISADLINTKENLYIFQKQLSSRPSSPQKPLLGTVPCAPSLPACLYSLPLPPPAPGA